MPSARCVRGQARPLERTTTASEAINASPVLFFRDPTMRPGMLQREEEHHDSRVISGIPTCYRNQRQYARPAPRSHSCGCARLQLGGAPRSSVPGFPRHSRAVHNPEKIPTHIAERGKSSPPAGHCEVVDLLDEVLTVKQWVDPADRRAKGRERRPQHGTAARRVRYRRALPPRDGPSRNSWGSSPRGT